MTYLILFSIFFMPIIQIATFEKSSPIYSLKTSGEGVSNYTITQSVTYDVQVNLSLSATSGRVYFRHPRFDDLQPGSSSSQYSGPFQQSQLIYSKIIGSQDPPAVIQDDYGNTFDLFNDTSGSISITFDQRYNITLNEVNYGDLSSLPITMNDYNVSDDMFLYFCNQSDSEVYQTDNSILIDKSNEIAGSHPNPFDKAKAIINYVSSHIHYTLLGGDEKGALWAEVNRTGDCSEYSSLMITLLRIQGIPARKAGGFMIVQDIGYRPYKGQSWTFSFNQLLAHAWVEYYIPTIGWIQCEPQIPSTIKTSSFLRFTQTLGAWFPFPYYDFVMSLQYYNLSEYNILFTALTSGLDYDYSITITVTDTNLLPLPDWLTLIIIISIIGVLIVSSIIVVRTIIKKRKYRSEW